MSDVVVTFDDAKLRRLFNSPTGPIAKKLLTTGQSVEGYAKRLCPVDTGRLRNSIDHKIGVDFDGLVCRIGSDVEYAKHVEEGTSTNSAQPYLRPALAAVVGFSTRRGR